MAVVVDAVGWAVVTTTRGVSPPAGASETPLAEVTSASADSAAATTSTSASPSPTGPTTSVPTSSKLPPSSTAAPTPTPRPSTTAPAPGTTATERAASPPAVQDPDISLTTGLLAVAALVLAGVALWVAHRTGFAESSTPRPQVRSHEPAVDTAATMALLVDLGEAMIDSGYTVTQAQTTLARVLDGYGIPEGEVIVLPTALFVSVPGATTVDTAVSAAGLSSLRLDQVASVSQIVSRAEAGTLSPDELRVALARARSTPPPHGPGTRTLGYALLATGLAMILRGSVADLIVAAALGAAVGALQLVASRSGAATRAVLPVLSAFLVAGSVFVVGRLNGDVSVVAPLIAPLVTFLPGALLTTAVIELTTGQMISGAGRLSAGILQLVLLALGVVAAAQLVGVPAPDIAVSDGSPPGDLAPWLGVALFGVGVLVHHCAPRASFGWVVLVLYVAYGAQIIGGLFLGAVLSAFVGALVMSPVASYVALRPSGPPLQVSFLPAFWLLVPGALGLVGVTQLLDQNRVDATSSLLSMGTTMIGVSFGVLIGLAFGATSARRLTSAGVGGLVAGPRQRHDAYASSLPSQVRHDQRKPREGSRRADSRD